MENAAKDYAAGVAAGLATVAVGHPFDTVKVGFYFSQQQHFLHARFHLQVNLQARSSGSGRVHSNAIQCAGWILKQEGVRGLYKGATSSFIGMAVESSLLFGIYAQTKTALQGGEAGTSTPKLSAVIPSAGLGGAIISMILCPTELVKCRLQVQDKNASNANLPRYNGPLECVRKSFQAVGIQELFRGWSATCARESVGNVCFFSTYETSRHLMLSYFAKTEDRVSRTLLEALVGIISGGLSGMAYWAAVLPFDVAKTRIQTAVDPKETKNLLAHLRTIHKELGYRGLYTGLGPTLVRAFPANAAAIVTWELTAKLLGSRHLQTLESSFV